MRVISKRRLKEFWTRSGCSDAKGPLTAWYAIVQQSSWGKWADLRKDYPSADQVGDCVVFNIGGNKYRLVARVRYPVRVYVLKVMTHAEYDENKWVKECGCNTPPPTPKKRDGRKKKKHGSPKQKSP